MQLDKLHRPGGTGMSPIENPSAATPIPVRLWMGTVNSPGTTYQIKPQIAVVLRLIHLYRSSGSGR